MHEPSHATSSLSCVNHESAQCFMTTRMRLFGRGRTVANVCIELSGQEVGCVLV